MRYQFPPGIVALVGLALLGIGLVGGRLPLTVVGVIVIALAVVRYLVGRR